MRVNPQEKTVLFAARQLGKSYGEGAVAVQALKAVDLDLYEGEFVVFLGASGSGKSTLLNILGGLDLPTTGDVFFQGQNLAQAQESQLTQYRRAYVGFVFQFYNLIPSLTARENVALVTDLTPQAMAPEAALTLVGLEARLDHFPAQLSGGEQQRVAIARAIAKRPRVLFCDEPTGALDFRTGKRVLAVLAQVNREFGTTVAVITHNGGIAAMADRVVHLRSGEILEIRENAVKQSPATLEW